MDTQTQINAMARLMLATYGDMMAAQEAAMGGIDRCNANAADCLAHNNESGVRYWQDAAEVAMLTYNAIGRVARKSARVAAIG